MSLSNKNNFYCFELLHTFYRTLTVTCQTPSDGQTDTGWPKKSKPL